MNICLVATVEIISECWFTYSFVTNQQCVNYHHESIFFAGNSINTICPVE